MKKIISFVIFISVFCGAYLISQSNFPAGVRIGSPTGPVLMRVFHGTVNLDLANTATITTSTQVVSNAITGAAIGDTVIVNPRALVETGLAQGECFVSAANTVSCTYVNPTIAGIDPAAQNFDVTVLRVR